jgi:hypothetical protein
MTGMSIKVRIYSELQGGEKVSLPLLKKPQQPANNVVKTRQKQCKYPFKPQFDRDLLSLGVLTFALCLMRSVKKLVTNSGVRRRKKGHKTLTGLRRGMRRMVGGECPVLSL